MKKLFLILLLVFFSFKAQAKNKENLHRETIAEIKYENSMYQLLSDYGMILTPLTGAVVCVSTFGTAGAVAGFVVGVVDEVLIYNGYASQKHLTLGLFGAGLGTLTGLPYLIGEWIGFGFVVGVTSGLVTPEIIAIISIPVNSLTTGIAYAHASGGHTQLEGISIGLGIGLVELYSNDNILSDMFSMMTVTAFFTPSLLAFIPDKDSSEFLVQTSFFPYLTGILYSLNRFNWSSFSPSSVHPKNNVLSPEKLKSELEELFAKVTDTDIITKMTQDQYHYKFGAAILSSQLSLKMAIHRQHLLSTLKVFPSGMGRIVPKGILPSSQLNLAFVSFGIFLFPQFLKMVLTEIIDEFQTHKLSRILKQAMREKILGGEIPLYLKDNAEMSSDFVNFETHINTLVDKGMAVVWSSANSHIQTMHSWLILSANNSLDLMKVLEFYSQMIESLTRNLQIKKNENSEKLADLRARILEFENDIKYKPKLVLTGRKGEFLQEKIDQAITEIRHLKAKDYKWEMMYNSIVYAQYLGNLILPPALIYLKMAQQEFPVATVAATNEASTSILTSGSWYLSHQETINSIEKAKKSLNKVLDFTAHPCDKHSSLTYKVDEINLNSIHLKNFKIGIAKTKQELISAEDIEIPAGRYVVVGDSGSGKSSFLSKIRGIKCNGIYAHGEVNFNVREEMDSEVYVMPQDDYIAPFSSMLELLTGKTSAWLKDKEDIRESAKDLLLTLQIDDLGLNGIAGKLDDVKSWAESLSGGQKRKVALAAMLLAKPSFVILDESFNGLDEQSIKVAQKLIREELKDSVILVVDHHAESNNYYGFYEHELQIKNKQLTIEPMTEY